MLKKPQTSVRFEVVVVGFADCDSLY